MATNDGNQVVTWRYVHTQQVHFFRRNIGFEEGGRTLKLGELPPGAIILKALSGVQVNTAFNAGTTNTLDIGITGTPNTYANALATGALGFVPLNQNVSEYIAAPTEIFVTLNTAGTAATAGRAAAILAFIPNNDLRIENV